MKDITVILVHYSNQPILNKALTSLKQIGSRLEKVIVIQERQIPLGSTDGCEWLEGFESIIADHSDIGITLNNIIQQITSKYVLFLEKTDYLSSYDVIDSMLPSDQRPILGTTYYNQNIAIQRPFLVLTSYLQKGNLLPDYEVPFKESLLSAWLSSIDNSNKTFKNGFVRQLGKNSSINTLKRNEFIQKYQLEKVKTNHPSLSVIISNYNMEKYVGTAITSCLLQNEQLEQILIMDDGSTDNSLEKLRRWNNEERIMVLNKKNEGKARALNDLLPHVTSDFILELDADDWLDPDAVSIIKKHLSVLPDDASVLYGNFRKWKQLGTDVAFKGIAKGTVINGKRDLLTYRFPLCPRIYRTVSLKSAGGFPVSEFEDGRLYEDVSVLHRLLKKGSRLLYRDFTVYNVREHKESITKSHPANWNDFLKTLK
ncbi:glycosyl transferase family 2 [Virgibacillus indicus]|uniref:Glycosyl transferase family 2 n=1 Tax=Virgibacillus indicus TaxID=2024554 RepID=A0A265NAB0_9BACI|nr:glycosyl transferase family 2 [Virgibacillus indicus]